jgi:hypothetical protein
MSTDKDDVFGEGPSTGNGKEDVNQGTAWDPGLVTDDINIL